MRRDRDLMKVEHGKKALKNNGNINSKINKSAGKKWLPGQIDGVVLKELSPQTDARGMLCETFRLDQLPTGLQPVMSYVSYTRPGVSRGPHEHQEQTDIFSFIGPGNFLLKLWDNRAASSTYLRKMEINAGRDNPLTITIPPGVVHGYKNIDQKEVGMVVNCPDRLYRGWKKKEEVDEIRHEDNPGGGFSMDSD